MNGRVTCVGVPARRRGTRVICYFRRRVCIWTGTNLTIRILPHWPLRLRPFASLRIVMSELFLVFYDRPTGTARPPRVLGWFVNFLYVYYTVYLYIHVA